MATMDGLAVHGAGDVQLFAVECITNSPFHPSTILSSTPPPPHHSKSLHLLRDPPQQLYGRTSVPTSISPVSINRPRIDPSMAANSFCASHPALSSPHWASPLVCPTSNNECMQTRVQALVQAFSKVDVLHGLEPSSSSLVLHSGFWILDLN